MAGQRNSLLAGFFGLGRDINKLGGRTDDETTEGVVGDLLPELELTMDEAEMVKLSDSWEKTWDSSDVKTKFVEQGDANEDYWKGKQYDQPGIDTRRSLVDNAIFEGLETYLPQVTRRNPDPMVVLAAEEDQDSKPNQQYVQALQHELADVADDLTMRLKMKAAARHKELYLLGVVKYSWDIDKDKPMMKIVRPRKIILDPDATVDEDGYTGSRIGEYRKLSASKLIKYTAVMPNATEIEAYITAEAKQELATELQFIEWWTNDYYFWKMGDKILLKRKNPHWNYDIKTAAAPSLPTDSETEPQEPVNSDGMDPTETQPPAPAEGAGGISIPPAGANTPPVPEIAPTEENAEPAPPTPQAPEPHKAINHFRSRKMPYALLVTFGLGKQPVDITSNIGQNLPMQDLINKRLRQIDKNADSMNQGLVVSLERSGLTKDEAKQVTEALRKGGTVVVPAGAPSDAVMRLPTPGLPNDVYNQLVDVRNRVRDIWGIRGSSPAGIANEDTVRGKLIVQGLDTDRIGGGISEYLEQLADQSYNWITQLLYVYDDRYAAAFASGTPIPKVRVSVKEGSLLPTDATTIANQAISLADSGKMATLDLYKKLDYPNPEELAANVWLEVNAPEILLSGDPRVAQVVQQKQQQAQAAAQAEAQAKAGAGGKQGPSESIAFKDLPPEGKAQMAAQAGIQLHPATIANHDAAVSAPTPGPVGGGTPTVPQITQ